MKSKSLLHSIRGGAFIVLCAISAPSGIYAQETQDEAGIRFQKGLELYEQGKLEAALEEFMASYSIKENHEVLYVMAKIYQSMGKNVSALKAWQKYIKDGGDVIPDDRKAEALTSIEALKKLVATLFVKCNIQGARLIINDLQAGVFPIVVPILVEPGSHILEIRADGYYPIKRKVVMQEGDIKTEEFILQAVPIDSSSVMPSPAKEVPAATPPPAPHMINYKLELSSLISDSAFVEKCAERKLKPKFKSVAATWALSFFLFPGAGQFFVGNTRNYVMGSLQGAIAVSGLIISIASVTHEDCTWVSYFGDECRKYEKGWRTNYGQTLGIVGMAIIGGAWLWSWIDALITAVTRNNRLATMIHEYITQKRNIETEP